MPFSQTWTCISPLLQQGLHLELLEKVADLRAQGRTIYPPQERIFRALELTAPNEVRCIILGQDPYHGPGYSVGISDGQAQGLAFSVDQATPPKAFPPSLRNIFKEIDADIYQGKKPYNTHNPDLLRWAKQGVLLLNTVLSVEQGKANSHSHLGWQRLTHDILLALAKDSQHPLAVLLWGKPAEAYASIFTSADQKHLVLTAPHPSPLSAHRGFFGCKHFSQVNTWLHANNSPSISW